MKVFLSFPNPQYSRMFQAQEGFSIVQTLAEAEMVVFTGGADVNPSLYEAEVHPKTRMSPQRDVDECSLYRVAKKAQLPCVGICRGAQLLNVLNGGKLYQHVVGHLGPHPVIDEQTRLTFQVSSTHHQMMMRGPDVEVLAYAIGVAGAKESCLKKKVVVTTDDRVDYEALYYPETNDMCFQPHPEFDNYHDCRTLFFRYINQMTRSSV